MQNLPINCQPSLTPTPTPTFNSFSPSLSSQQKHKYLLTQYNNITQSQIKTYTNFDKFEYEYFELLQEDDFDYREELLEIISNPRIAQIERQIRNFQRNNQDVMRRLQSGSKSKEKMIEELEREIKEMEKGEEKEKQGGDEYERFKLELTEGEATQFQCLIRTMSEKVAEYQKEIKEKKANEEKIKQQYTQLLAQSSHKLSLKSLELQQSLSKISDLQQKNKNLSIGILALTKRIAGYDLKQSKRRQHHRRQFIYQYQQFQKYKQQSKLNKTLQQQISTLRTQNQEISQLQEKLDILGKQNLTIQVKYTQQVEINNQLNMVIAHNKSVSCQMKEIEKFHDDHITNLRKEFIKKELEFMKQLKEIESGLIMARKEKERAENRWNYRENHLQVLIQKVMEEVMTKKSKGPTTEMRRYVEEFIEMLKETAYEFESRIKRDKEAERKE